MPDWAWLIAIFVALSAGYTFGFTGGSWKADTAPTEKAWVTVREYSIDAWKEVELAKVKALHDEEIAMIERGLYDDMCIEETVESSNESEEENDA